MESARRREPDLAKCRAKLAGFGNFVDCLAVNPHLCRYSIAFGDGYLCLHSAGVGIVERTRSESTPASS